MAFAIMSSGMPVPPCRTRGMLLVALWMRSRASKSRPFQLAGVDAVDVADAGGQEVDAQISDLGALCGVSDLAITHDAVLDAADGADLGFDAHALGVCRATSSLVFSTFSSME